MMPAIDLLCRARFEMRDWQSALCGEREGLDELCEEIDRHLFDAAIRDGYNCPNACRNIIPHNSSFCPHCGFGPPGAA